MYVDSQLLFSDDQALTATAVSTNVVELDTVQQIGQGEPMGVFVSVSVAADFTTTDETYQFDLQTDTVENFASPTVIASQVVAASLLGVGDSVVIPIGYFNEQFLRMNYTLGGTTPTVTLSAELKPMRLMDGYTDYPDGYEIT